MKNISVRNESSIYQKNSYLSFRLGQNVLLISKSFERYWNLGKFDNNVRNMARIFRLEWKHLHKWGIYIRDILGGGGPPKFWSSVLFYRTPIIDVLLLTMIKICHLKKFNPKNLKTWFWSQKWWKMEISKNFGRKCFWAESIQNVCWNLSLSFPVLAN